jgi:hypothetical protein
MCLMAFAVFIVSCQVGYDGKQNVKVLLAANPDEARAEAFMGFLEDHFVLVGSVPYEEFKPADADNYDVIIFDGGLVVIDSNRINMPKTPEIPKDFSRPMILIGGPGIGVAERNFDTKIGWL